MTRQASREEVQRILSSPKSGSLANDVEVSFPSKVGRFYQLQSSVDLKTWPDDSLEFGGTGELMTIGVANALAAKERYYRVKERGE